VRMGSTSPGRWHSTCMHALFGVHMCHQALYRAFYSGANQNIRDHVLENEQKHSLSSALHTALFTPSGGGCVCKQLRVWSVLDSKLGL
jgi:hypothetical protein